MIDPITKHILRTEKIYSRSSFKPANYDKKEIAKSFESAHDRLSNLLENRIKNAGCEHIKDRNKQDRCWKHKQLSEKYIEKIVILMSKLYRKHFS